MKESFSHVVEAEQPPSRYERQQAAMDGVMKSVLSRLAERESEPNTFVCPSGKEQVCENGYDIEIAKTQEMVAVAREYVAEVENIDPHQEQAAKKLLEYLQTQADVLVRKAELESLGVDPEGLYRVFSHSSAE